MRYEFESVSGPTARKRFMVNGDQSGQVGRGQACELQLEDPHLSRVHFGLAAADGAITMSDLGSSAETLVAGRPIQSVTLSPGSSFRAGNSEVRLTNPRDAEDETLRGTQVGGERPSAWSDLIGLGATRYPLLTGRPPNQSDLMSDLIQAVRMKNSEPPKTYQLFINDLFQAVLMQLLAKEPGNRYPTATVMLMELERIGKLNNMPIA